jgi:hypothetical protein
MKRPYSYSNLNWRDQTNRWEWSEAYAGWLALADQHRLEERCRITRRDATKSAYQPK